MWRDFTHVDDIVEGVVRIADITPSKNEQWTVETCTSTSSFAPYAVCNIGHESHISLMDFVKSIEGELGIETKSCIA